MSRFNLLLVRTPADTGRKALKAVSRVFRQNFVFEVQDLNEAEELLNKLNINLVLVDLDTQRADLSAFSETHPRTLVWGLSNKPFALDSRIHPLRNRVFHKKGFVPEMIAELKAFRKETQATQASDSRRFQPKAVSNDFKDFVQLVPSVAN